MLQALALIFCSQHLNARQARSLAWPLQLACSQCAERVAGQQSRKRQFALAQQQPNGAGGALAAASALPAISSGKQLFCVTARGVGLLLQAGLALVQLGGQARR